jgi:phosphatidylserine decarboxylase
MTTAAPVPYRVGQWLPTDHAFLVRWLEAMVAKTHAQPRALHPVIADLRQLIETDPEIFMLFNQMFEQVPKRPPYDRDPCGRPQVRDYQHMLQLLDSIMTHAPEFDQTGLVGCPINAIFRSALFHCGGSTHCLIFRPGVKLEFDQHGHKPGLHGANIHVNARIATVLR